jgi:transposase
MKMPLTDFQKKRLEQELTKPHLSPRDKMRVQIMLLCGQGKSQKQICDFLNCAPVTARTWIHVVKSDQAHRWRDFCQDGRPKTIENHHRDRLIALFKQSPRQVGFPFEKWTSTALQRQLFKEFEIKVSARHINRVLNEAGFSTRTPPKAEPERANESASGSIVIQDLHDSSNSNLLLWPSHIKS